MKRRSTLFLKTVLIFIAIGSLAALIRFPQTEGRAANLDLLSIYTDPLIIYTFITSIPFFVALSQAFKLLGYIDTNKVFTKSAVKAVRNIKYCASSIIAFLALALFYIRVISQPGDDPAGPTMLGFVAIFASAVIATAAAVFQKLLQNAVDMKSENDLTV